jgi:hypothetical protein
MVRVLHKKLYYFHTLRERSPGLVYFGLTATEHMFVFVLKDIVLKAIVQIKVTKNKRKRSKTLFLSKQMDHFLSVYTWTT